MNNTLKITVSMVRGMLGQKTSRYLAKLGETGWQCEGSKETALSGLERALARQAQYGNVHRYLRANGAMFCLSYNNGWEYAIVRDVSPDLPSWCGLSCETEREAMQAMQSHFDQWQADGQGTTSLAETGAEIQPKE